MEAVKNELFFPNPDEAEDFCKKHLALQKGSGLSRKKYCKLNNINYPRFCYWVNKMTGNSNSDDPQKSSLIAVNFKKEAFPLEASESLCTLSLSHGRSLKIHNLNALAFVLERIN